MSITFLLVIPNELTFFPLDNYFTPVNKNRRSYLSSVELQSCLNERDFNCVALIKCTIVTVRSNTAFNSCVNAFEIALLEFSASR